MIPLRDENPTRTVAIVTYLIIAINVIIYLYNGALVPERTNPLAGYELVPRALTQGDIQTPIPPWMTIFTSMFMHANILHLAGNMLFLWVFGNNIEDVLGHVKFLVFYLLCGLAAVVLQVSLSPGSTTPMVGASGAIAGVLGAYMVLFPTARIITLVFLFVFVQFIALPAYVVLGLWFVVQLLNSVILAASRAEVQGGVAYWAHIGGFVAGLILVHIFGGKRLLGGRHPIEYRRDPGWFE